MIEGLVEIQEAILGREGALGANTIHAALVLGSCTIPTSGLAYILAYVCVLIILSLQWIL